MAKRQNPPRSHVGRACATGKEEDRRRRVLDYLKQNYPPLYSTLKDEHDGQKIHELYKVTLWPTIVVLDQRGLVRHVLCGDRPWLQSERSGHISKLLDDDP